MDSRRHVRALLPHRCGDGDEERNQYPDSGQQSPAGGHGRLFSDAAKFGPDRIDLPARTTVAPGQNDIFPYDDRPTNIRKLYAAVPDVTGGVAWFGQILFKPVTIN